MASSALTKRRGDSDLSTSKFRSKKGLELIWKSEQSYADILSSFRECHDLCVGSKLFSDDIISTVDQCAVDFRLLSLDSVSIAKRVSNQWLDMALLTFENLKDIESPEDMFELLGKQARELSCCFKVIAAWAGDLGERFHQAHDGTIKESEGLKKVFEKAMEEKKESVETLKKKRHDITKDRQECQQRVDSFRSRLEATPIPKLRDVFRNHLLPSAENKLSEARKTEQMLDEDIRKAEEDFKVKRTQNDKAEVNKVNVVLFLYD